MSNRGNFSQAMREILGLDPSQDKAKANDEVTKASESNENYVSEDQISEEPINNDRLNQDFNKAFKQSTQETKNIENQSNQNNYTYNQQQVNNNNEEPAFFDKPGYGQATQNNPSGNNFEANTAKLDNGFGGGNSGNGFGGGNSGNGFGDNQPYDNDEVGTTIITRNTIIEGNIKSFENIELNGKVKGKIDTTKNVGVSGFVQGDIEATDILLEGAQIKGSISSKGALLMDKDTLLVGDVEAQNTRVDGKIKGEVNIGGNGEFLSNSVVVGNITVSNFYVQYGARMQGYINTNFSKNEEDSIFGQIVGN